MFRSVDYHILVKSGTRRSRSVPPFRSGNYKNPIFTALQLLRYIATPNIGGDIPIDVPTNQNIGGDTSPASPAGLTSICCLG